MSIAEIVVVDADASSASSLSLFVQCARLAAVSSSTAAIRVQLLDPPTLYEAEVSSRHKPRVLDCSGVEYVAAVETALSPVTDAKPRFEFRWSRPKRTLTLMERSEFAMKFCAIEFQATESGDKWRMLLHQVAAQQQKERKLIDNKRSRVTQLEALLEQKEELLETALTAKQSTEDCLIQGFCAVLNAKKDEIRRLQDEVELVQRYGVKPTTKKKPAVKRARKATGAKLTSKEEESDESSKESDEDMRTEEDEDEGELKRAKRDAVSAYSQLPANLKSSSVQISSAEDLLSSMDDIIKNEEKVDEATQRGDTTTQVKSEPVSVPQVSRPHEKKARAEQTAPPKPKPAKPTPVDETMDSEEEDILDMLS
ncbi:hypothetical protein F442_14552 [Phytophthora nicotianae P10297]|uniref:DNA repair protein XRCC4 n=1 Tax=Phytophthora nicotianae P10297 TaxID=1317064 RepID=W2YUL7_PHYNI|nr:hypothetical protein F442_14552 [Phytophthora nicotianae P10297]